MKKIFSMLLVLSLLLSVGVSSFAAPSPSSADVEEVHSSAVTNVAAAPAEVPAPVIEDVDQALAELEEADHEVADALKAFFEEHADNLGQGVIVDANGFTEAEVKAHVVAGEKYLVLFSDGSSVVVECLEDGVLVIPFPADAAYLGYVILPAEA